MGQMGPGKTEIIPIIDKTTGEPGWVEGEGVIAGSGHSSYENWSRAQFILYTLHVLACEFSDRKWRLQLMPGKVTCPANSIPWAHKRK